MTTLAKLKARFAALPSPADVPLTYAAQEADAALRSRLAGQIQTAEVAQRILAELQPRLKTDEAYLAVLEKVSETLERQYLAAVHPKTDHDRGVLMNLQVSLAAVNRGTDIIDGSGWSLETLELGKQMAGVVWRGGRPEVEGRIKDLRTRINDAAHRLDDALLDDAEREKRDRAAAKRAAEFNALSTAEKKARHNAARQARGFGVAPDVDVP